MSNTAITAQLEPKRRVGRPEGFAAETARNAGLSKASINRALRRCRMICQDARDLIRHSKLDKGAYLDALIGLDLTDEEQVEQVHADLEGGRQPAHAKARTIRYDDTAEAVAGKLRALFGDDVLADIWRTL
jgi:putative lipoic acid-binding regulatory protein